MLGYWIFFLDARAESRDLLLMALVQNIKLNSSCCSHLPNLAFEPAYLGAVMLMRCH